MVQKKSIKIRMKILFKNIGVLRHLYLLSLCRKKTERSVTERHGDADQRENGLLKNWQKMDHIKHN